MKNYINRKINNEVDNAVETLKALNDALDTNPNLATCIALDKERQEYEEKLMAILFEVTIH
jgi:predicted translin family RNA/ssDNA-binding protein